jgi:hypothetical protein
MPKKNADEHGGVDHAEAEDAGVDENLRRRKRLGVQDKVLRKRIVNAPTQADDESG